jgi:glycosyltransferase involved in cell wall biosynthesis
MLRGLAQRGHNIQLLTSDYRLPPMGMEGERGIYRQLRLYPTPLEAGSELGSSFAATYQHERYNAGALDERIRRFRPDLVYVWNMRGLSKSLLFRMQASGLPMVFDVHADWLLPENFREDPWNRWWSHNPSLRSKLYRGGSHMLGRTRRILRALPIGESSDLRVASGSIASDWLRAELECAGLSQAAGLPLIYPGLDLGRIIPKKAFKRKNHFLWAGRLKEAKGADLAVDAVGRLKARGIDVTLDLFGMGDPSERKAERLRIEDCGLIDRVRMRGIRPGEMARHYAHYDAILYTNRVGEPFSITLLEAMLSKLPVISAKVGGNQELLDADRNALLFEPGDVDALAAAMETFLQLPDAGEEMASEDYEGLCSRHSHHEVCARMEPILTGAVGRSVPTA